MKNSQIWKSILVTTLAMLTMVGCAKSDSNNGARLGARGGNGAIPTGAVNMSTAPGTMTYVSSSGGGVNSAVSALLAESNPNGTGVGTVDPNTGITFAGQVHVDSASPVQNMISASSYLEIQIRDSLSISSPTQYSPFLIAIGMNSTGKGQVQSYGSYDVANLVFQDQFGWILLSGDFNGSVYQGTAYFGEGSYTGTSGTYLANFSIPTCSFFSCQ